MKIISGAQVAGNDESSTWVVDAPHMRFKD